MNQLPHDIGIAEVTDSIYDKLMHNTEQGLSLLSCSFQEVDAKEGYIYLDFETEKGTKRVHINIKVEDCESNTDNDSE